VNSLLRLAACASLLGLFCVGAFALFPAAVGDAGLDLTEWFRCQRILDIEERRGEEITRLQGEAMQRHHAKNAVARELIAGRLTLAEATARFADLPGPPPHMVELLRRCYGGVTAEESMCRHVIEWSCQILELEKQTEQSRALRDRLEKELQSLRPGAQLPQ
jgi:hypothetical protein